MTDPQRPGRPGSRSGFGGFSRYTAVGAVATAAHYALLVALVEALAVPPPLASALGAVLGAQVAFVGNRRFTFAHAGPWWGAWWRFQGTAVLGAALGAAIVAGGVALGLHYLLAQAVATGASMLLTFWINRRWSFGAR